MWKVRSVLRARELSRLDDLGQDVGAHLHDVLAQQPHAPRHGEVVDEGRRRAQTSKASNRSGRAARQTVAPEAVSTISSEVAVEAVERMDGGDQQREGRDDGHQVGQRQRGHLDQHPHVLALAR